MTQDLSSNQRKQDRHLFHDLRVFLSGCAVLLASLLCHNLAHFTMVPSEPSTWLLATQHRCGWLLIATVSWFFVETISRIYFGLSLSRQLKRSN
jgi:Na+/phosphate symporter